MLCVFHGNVLKSITMISNSKQRTDRKQKNTVRRKTSFPKGQVENTDLYKALLNKIMLTDE